MPARSRWLVGSSRSRRSGVATSSRASAVRLFSPPERVRASRSQRSSGRPMPPSTTSTRRSAFQPSRNSMRWFRGVVARQELLLRVALGRAESLADLLELGAHALDLDQARGDVVAHRRAGVERRTLGDVAEAHAAGQRDLARVGRLLALDAAQEASSCPRRSARRSRPCRPPRYAGRRRAGSPARRTGVETADLDEAHEGDSTVDPAADRAEHPTRASARSVA